MARSRRPTATRPALALGVVLPIALGGRPLDAQRLGPPLAEPLTAPPGLILPNYARVPIGSVEGLEGGAYVARTDDPAANWYNPAGLALAETAVNASTNAYELIRVSLGTADATAARIEISPLGTFTGAAIGRPLLRSSRWRLGVSAVRPVSWRPGAIDLAGTRATPAGAARFAYRSDGELRRFVGTVGAGARLTPRVRAGVGAGLEVVSLVAQQTLVERVIATDRAAVRRSTVAADGSAWYAVALAGVQWDAAPRVRVGARLFLPGPRLAGRGPLTVEASALDGGTAQDAVVRDAEARFAHPRAASLTVGVAYGGERAAVEVDAAWHAAADAVTPYATGAAGELLAVDDGVPTLRAVRFAPPVTRFRQVLNLAVGGTARLTRRVRLHGGVHTDHSPVVEAAGSPFRAVDLYGASAGISVRLAQLSGTAGIRAVWGSGDRDELGALLGPTADASTLRVQGVTAVYAVKVEF